MRADDSDSGAPNAPPERDAASSGAAAFIFQGDALCYVNPAAEAMTGYRAEELLAMQFWAVIHPDDRELVRRRGLARQRGEAVPWTYEVKIQPKRGDPLLVEFSGGIIEYDGKPAVLGIAVDVSQRRAAIARARDTESRQRALLENSSDVVLIIGPDLRVRYVGASIQRILGLTPREMEGDDNLHRIHPDDQPQVRAAYAALLAAPGGGRASATYRIRHRDGSWHWFESLGTNMLDDPCVAGIIVNSRDVTDRVEAQTAYRSLVDHSLQGLLIIQDLRIVFANPRIAEITGYSVAELLALPPDAPRTLIHPDDRDGAWRDVYRRAEETGEPGHVELRIVRRDGAVRWIETGVSRVEYRGRAALQAAHVDVTERKRAQEDAQVRQQELAHVLRRRTMGEMAAMFAHEVNQPLSAIMSYAKGCMHRLRTGGPPEPLLAALDEIASQAMRAAEIIKRLRRFVRKGELQRQRLQLNDLVEEVMRFVTPETRERSVRVQLELAADLPPLDVDAVQIEQVILNLMRNALDAMYEEPGQPALLVVRTRRITGAVEVSVSDRGAGLHPDVAADIFEPFVTSKPDGLGMGLSICRSIVDAHGGQVWATPNPDRGVTFHFTLPLPPTAQQRASG